jgi:hypothetical protein
MGTPRLQLSDHLLVTRQLVGRFVVGIIGSRTSLVTVSSAPAYPKGSRSALGHWQLYGSSQAADALLGKLAVWEV